MTDLEMVKDCYSWPNLALPLVNRTSGEVAIIFPGPPWTVITTNIWKMDLTAKQLTYETPEALLLDWRID